MRRFVLLILAASPLWAADPPLRVSSERAVSAPWTVPIDLSFPEDGPFRLEATDLGGEPVEVVIERLSGGRVWSPVATNRTPKGGLEVIVDFAFEAGAPWRVRPAEAVNKTVVLRLRRSAFSALRSTLKQELTTRPEVSLPLRLRASLPLQAGGESLSAAVSPRGALWVAWKTPAGAEVWDVGRGERLGSPLISTLSAPWEELTLSGTDEPVVTGRFQNKAEARIWNGQAWQEEAAPTPLLRTEGGTFRAETEPFPRIWRSTAAGWQDLELPRSRVLDLLLLGSTEDGLYVFLASSTERERALYRWTLGLGWSALPPPPAVAPPRKGLWAATHGAGSLFYVEGEGTRLMLRQFDGHAWREPLDLSPLVPTGLRSLAILSPSVWSRTGSLVLASTHVSIYDFP